MKALQIFSLLALVGATPAFAEARKACEIAVSKLGISTESYQFKEATLFKKEKHIFGDVICYVGSSGKIHSIYRDREILAEDGFFGKNALKQRDALERDTEEKISLAEKRREKAIADAYAKFEAERTKLENDLSAKLSELRKANDPFLVSVIDKKKEANDSVELERVSLDEAESESPRLPSEKAITLDEAPGLKPAAPTFDELRTSYIPKQPESIASFCVEYGQVAFQIAKGKAIDGEQAIRQALDGISSLPLELFDEAVAKGRTSDVPPSLLYTTLRDECENDERILSIFPQLADQHQSFDAMREARIKALTEQQRNREAAKQTLATKEFDPRVFRAAATDIQRKFTNVTVELPYSNSMNIVFSVSDVTFVDSFGFLKSIASGQKYKTLVCSSLSLPGALNGHDTFVAIYLQSPRKGPRRLTNFLDC